MVELDQVTVSGKPASFAVELHLIFIQIQCLTYQPLSDALHPHTQYLFFLCICHMLQVLQIS